MGTAIKHPVSDWVKQSFVIFDIRALWHLSYTHMATMGVILKGLDELPLLSCRLSPLVFISGGNMFWHCAASW